MFHLIRPKNLLLIMLLQVLVLIHLGTYNYLQYDTLKTICLIFATVAIAAAGYVINDYFDVKIDLINKPEKVLIGQEISRRSAIILHITLTVSGIAAAWMVNKKTFVVALACAIMLYVYSSSLKKQFLTGNLVIALLSALSVYICKCYIPDLDDSKILAYSIFAGLSTLLREIVKDVEDEKGDSMFQSKSLAIQLGMRKTKKMLYFTSGLLLFSLFYYVFTLREGLNEGQWTFFLYLVILLAGVAIPLILFVFRLKQADRKIDFSHLSRLIKIIMLIGIFSIMFS